MKIKEKVLSVKQDTLKHVASSSIAFKETYHKKRNDRICIGVTGLSRSGKTTFITSLINQLEQHAEAGLPGFSSADNIFAFRIHPLEDTSLLQFPYNEAIEALSDEPPHWPESTANISGCLLEVKYKKKTLFGNSNKSLFVELRDYPGEWLLDLPLMEMEFSDWCGQCLSLFTSEPRSSLLGELFSELQNIDPLDLYDEEVCNRLNLKYRNFLRQCKTGENSLSLVQPGRFLIPGEFENSDILNFFPILSCHSYTEDQLKAAHEDSFYKVLDGRYEKYVKKIVRPFFKKFIKPINRQVILVDVINALHGGPNYLNDMANALAQVKDVYSYGRKNALSRFFTTSIDRLVIAATKVDQVCAREHEAVRQLLNKVVQKAKHTSAFEGVPSELEVIASIRSSKEMEYNGETVISGYDAEEQRKGFVSPKIPEHYPKENDYINLENWVLPDLKPLNGRGLNVGEAIPYIRIDIILDKLLGDLMK